MQKNFYQKIIEEIEELITNQNYSKALKIIETELNMPYVPSFFEKKIAKFNDIIKEKLQITTSSNKSLTLFSIIDLLNDEKYDLLVKIDVVEQLDNFNLNKEINSLIKLIANENLNYLIKIEIIKILIKQKIDYNFSITFNNTKILFNPIKKQLFISSDFYKNNYQFISHFFMKFINLKQISLEMLETIYYNLFLEENNFLLNNNISKEVCFIVCSFFKETKLQKKILESISKKNSFEKTIKDISKFI